MFKRRKPEDETASETQAPGLPGAPGEAQPAGAAQRPADTGLGVPPFRPVPSPVSGKEASPMSRSPYGVPSAGASLPQSGSTATRPGALPSARATPAAPPAPAERRTLVVGHGITVQGTVQDAERLVVEGTVEASEIHASELAISPGGVFKGAVEVEDAEVAGTIDGTLTANGNLVVRGSGRVIGTARCRRLQVEDGGQISGRIEMITDAAPSPAASKPAAPVPNPQGPTGAN